MDIIFSFAGFYALIRVADYWLRARGYRGSVSDHFDGNKFFNYGVAPGALAKKQRMSFAAWLWLLKRPKNNWRREENSFVGKPPQSVVGGEIVVTFVNHASVLIQTEGLNILTDPIWSERASPFGFAGPVRYRDPGIRFEDLPSIDIVLISHNHYDHMDIKTLKRLRDKWDPRIYTGLGNKEYLVKKKITNVFEIDWFQNQEVGDGVRVVCVPGQHFSSRALSDRNNTLWCGFVIESPHGDIYFAGDTGYGEFVGKLREHYKKFRLAFLPIGAFKPEWFMSSVHTSPEEAFRMHSELNAETSIGIHHATFRLADDGQREPEERIHKLNTEKGESKPNFLILSNGESVSFPEANS